MRAFGSRRTGLRKSFARVDLYTFFAILFFLFRLILSSLVGWANLQQEKYCPVQDSLDIDGYHLIDGHCGCTVFVTSSLYNCCVLEDVKDLQVRIHRI